MKTKIIIILLILISALVIGCVEQSKADNGRFTVIQHVDPGQSVQVGIIHDNLNNVTIYTFDRGCSAIPDWMINHKE